MGALRGFSFRGIKMSAASSHPPPPEPKLKIYFLPNLLTAGNLFCGFVALTKIVEANLTPDADTGFVNWTPIKVALAFILLACIFDLFDGRVARMGGRESPFGREFDSLADLISFGAAPNEIKSASESNSRPNGLSLPPMRATRPSNKSKMQASKMAPSANLIG